MNRATILIGMSFPPAASAFAQSPPSLVMPATVAPSCRPNPLGAKGIGELPMVGVAAAIANAVYHATGIRVRKVPIRIEDVLT